MRVGRKLTGEAAFFLGCTGLFLEVVMDGLAVAELKSVLAPLSFLVPMAEKPVAYNYTPPPGVPVKPEKAKTIG